MPLHFTSATSSDLKSQHPSSPFLFIRSDQQQTPQLPASFPLRVVLALSLACCNSGNTIMGLVWGSVRDWCPSYVPHPQQDRASNRRYIFPASSRALPPPKPPGIPNSTHTPETPTEKGKAKIYFTHSPSHQAIPTTSPDPSTLASWFSRSTEFLKPDSRIRLLAALAAPSFLLL